MSEPTSFRAVIELWPTKEACASEVGANASQVSKWGQRNSIPAEWWTALLTSTTAKAVGLTSEILTKLAARVGDDIRDSNLAEARP